MGWLLSVVSRQIREKVPKSTNYAFIMRKRQSRRNPEERIEGFEYKDDISFLASNAKCIQK